MKDTARVSLLRIGPPDVDLLRRIAIDTYLDHFKFLWDDQGNWYVKELYRREVLEQELQQVYNFFYIIFQDSNPLGFVKVNMDSPLPGSVEGSVMELEKIYLRRNETGKGFGQVCLRMVFDLGLQKLKNIVWLKAMDSSLAAIGFYQRAGFDFCGTHRLDYPLMKEQFRGMVIMQKNLLAL